MIPLQSSHKDDKILPHGRKKRKMRNLRKLLNIYGGILEMKAAKRAVSGIEDMKRMIIAHLERADERKIRLILTFVLHIVKK